MERGGQREADRESPMRESNIESGMERVEQKESDRKSHRERV